MLINDLAVTGSFTVNGTPVQLTTTGSLATTGSNSFTGSQSISGSLTTTGTITAQSLIVNVVSSSIVYSSGSNIFGNSLSNTQQLTGSVSITGSLTYNGANITTIGNVTAAATTGAGQVAFFNGANVITSVSGLYFDGVNKLGIGTISPSALLHLNSSGTTNLYIQSGTGNEAVIRYFSGTTEVATARANLSGSYFIETGVGSPTEKLRITSGGNVGIGTSTPSYLLDVAGTSRSDLHIFRSNQSAPTADAFIFRPADNSIALGTANSERVRVDSSGNVGIGTTSPTAKLQIQNIVASGNSNILTIDAEHGTSAVSLFEYNHYGTGNGSGFLRFNRANGTISSPTIVSANQVSGRVGSRVYDGAQYFDNTLIRFSVDGTPALNDTPGRIEFYTTPAGSNSLTERMRLNASGNLGLGVVPSAWSLGKAIEISGGPSVLGLSNSTQISNNAYYNSGWIYKATSFAQNFVLDNDGSFKFFQAPSGTAGNAISFTQAMTLDASGRLGLGETSPAYLLDLVKNQNASTISSISNSTSNTAAYSALRIASSTNVWLYNFSNGYTTSGKFAAGTFLLDVGTVNGININTSDAAPIILSTTNTERLRITSGGDVGIGCTPAYSKLHVRAEDTSNTYPSAASINVGNYESAAFGRTMGINFSVGAGNTTEFIAGVYGVYTSYSTSVGGALAFITNNGSSSFSEKMRITSGGLVGIGTTSPQAKLHIAQSSSAVLFAQDGTTATIVGTDSAGTASQGLFLRGFPLTFTGNGGGSAAQMTLNASGNLGLGVVPSAWQTSIVWRGLEIDGRVSFISAKSEYFNILTNAYRNNSSQYIYSTTAAASNYAQNEGKHEWFTAPSGTAGNAISFTQAMTLDASGNLGVGTTSPSAYGKLAVNGNIGMVSHTQTLFANKIQIVSSSGDMEMLGGSANILFKTGASNDERLRITSTGYVSTNANTALQNPPYLQGMSFGWNKSNGQGESMINWSNAGGGSNPDITFNYWNNSTLSERLRITSGGRILMGTTSDDGSSRLQVSGAITARGSLYSYIEGQTALRTYAKGATVEISCYQSDNGSPYTKTTDIVANADSGVASQMRLLTTTTGGTPTTALTIKGDGIINLANVPSSATGLSSGDIYKDASGFLKIV